MSYSTPNTLTLQRVKHVQLGALRAMQLMPRHFKLRL